MTHFQVTILGCGSAMPTTYRNPTSQLIEVNEKLFMIDCGEGTQLQMRKQKAKMSKLHYIHTQPDGAHRRTIHICSQRAGAFLDAVYKVFWKSAKL